ncbi:Rha family transcriptional regulator [Anaerosporobacter sp.]
MDNEIILKEVDGEVRVSSREIAERFGKRHTHVLDIIKGFMSEMSTAEFSALFKKAEYKASNGKSNIEYQANRDGFSLLAMGFTGSEALQWKLKYIEAFNKMETTLKEQNAKALPTSYKEALLQLIEQVEENEKLLSQIDVYERFLCSKTGMLTKTELSTKLDTKPQTLASKLKKAGVYTKTSQISGDFLKHYPDTKIIVECDNTYFDGNGVEHNKPDFQWTYEGSKILVDYLISLGMVTFTENNGFKLKSA